ncbi:MAG: hypothetical protein WAZ18_06730 [Alphaproteobacteria bacterium]
MTDNLPAFRLLMAHGLKGAIKAKFMLEHPQFVVGHTLPTSREGLTLTVERIQDAPQNRHIVHVKESVRREDAEALGGVVVYLPKALIPPPPVGEVYLMELVGKPVVLPDGTAAGTVAAVLENPAHPLMELEGGKLIPAHTHFVEDLMASPLVLTEMGEAVYRMM